MKNRKIQKAEWDKVAKWWDDKAGNKGVWHQLNDIDPIIFKMLGKIKNKRILEIGCGNGYLSRSLTKKGAKMTAIDLSKEFIDIAKNKENLKPLGIKYLVRNADHLIGIKNKYFDIVVSNMALMDIMDAKRAIKEMGRVLKKRGRLIFSITHPAFDDFYQQWIIVRYEGKKYFGRVVTKYLTPNSKPKILWASKVVATWYHRPLGVYFDYLGLVNFSVNKIKEIATMKKLKRAVPTDGDVKFRGSRYRTSTEKRMKQLTRNEIPMFLVVEAMKK